MNEFKTYHPIVNFIYFVAAIGFSMFLMNPVCLIISLICSLTYSAVLNGWDSFIKRLFFIIPMMLLAALINPAFNHEGVTIIEYLPSGNPLTLESILYGLAASVMLVSVICWFSCYTAVMTSDKFIYLFGKIIPSLSLILSMTLRFVPRFISQIKIVSNAQRCIGRDVSSGSIIQRAKHGLSILSIMITWALESSVETANSMKSRGYGLPGRTAFSIFRFDRRDKKTLLCIVLLSIYILISAICGSTDFRYFPSIKIAPFSVYGASVYTAYFALCALPVIIECWEGYKWKAMKSKI